MTAASRRAECKGCDALQASLQFTHSRSAQRSAEQARHDREHGGEDVAADFGAQLVEREQRIVEDHWLQNSVQALDPQAEEAGQGQGHG